MNASSITLRTQVEVLAAKTRPPSSLGAGMLRISCVFRVNQSLAASPASRRQRHARPRRPLRRALDAPRRRRPLGPSRGPRALPPRLPGRNRRRTDPAAALCPPLFSFRQKSSFRVLGLQQVAIGGPDKRALGDLWVDVFGLRRKGSFRSEKENVDEDILELGRGPLAVEVDIMQPLDPDRAPKVHVPPLNHIGLWIDDLPAAVDALAAKGVRFTPGGIRKGAAGFDVAFIHPKGNDAAPRSGQGVLIELVQAPAHVIKAFDAIDE